MMRRAFALLACTALALVVAACTSTSEPSVETTTSSTFAALVTTTSSAAAATTSTTAADLGNPYGGEVVAVSAQEPATLNPFLPGGDNAIVGQIGQAYLVGVYDIDGNTLELIPEVVTELPTTENEGVVVNEDGTMTVRYTIEEEAVWEDGTPISGEDLLFTYETIVDPELPTFKLVYEDIISESVKVGPKTFEYTLPEPTVQYETLFDTIIPKHAVEGSDFAKDWNTEMWPSGGPFRFENWEIGESITVVRNENYWGTDPITEQRLPFLDRVTWRFIPEFEDAFAAFEGRGVDILQPESSTEVIDQLQGLEGEGAVVEVLSGTTWEHLNWQFGPGVDERNESSCNESFEMRLAVAQAVDRQRIVDEIMGGRVPQLDGYVSVFVPALATDAWAQYEYDPEAAAESYAAATEATGDECSVAFTTTSNSENRMQVAELLAEMLGEAGIPYENEPEDSQLFFGETLNRGLWDMGQWAWSSAPGLSSLVGIHDLWDPEGLPPSGKNYYRWGTEDSSVRDEATVEYAELRDAMNATVEVDELEDMIQTAERLLADNLVFLPLYPSESVAAAWDTVGNFKHNPTTGYYTWNIGEWYETDAS